MQLTEDSTKRKLFMDVLDATKASVGSNRRWCEVSSCVHSSIYPPL